MHTVGLVYAAQNWTHETKLDDTAPLSFMIMTEYKKITSTSAARVSTAKAVFLPGYASLSEVRVLTLPTPREDKPRVPT